MKLYEIILGAFICTALVASAAVASDSPPLPSMPTHDSSSDNSSDDGDGEAKVLSKSDTPDEGSAALPSDQTKAGQDNDSDEGEEGDQGSEQDETEADPTEQPGPLPLVNVAERVPIPVGVCMSWGSAANGLLINGVEFPASPGCTIRRSNRDYATPELIEAVLYAVETVQVTYPGAHDIYIGDLSSPGGGGLRPHKSHQNGRDIDIGMYFRDGMARGHFADMDESNLDVPKTWTLIEAMIENGKAEYIFLDYAVQEIFYCYCRDNLKKSQAFLDAVFQYPKGKHARQGLIRHARGHRNHLHVRFYCPRAVASAEGYFPTEYDYAMARQGRIIGSAGSVDYEPGSATPRATAAYRPSTTRTVASGHPAPRPDGPSLIYVVAENDSLSTIAARFEDDNVTAGNIRRWNNMAGNQRIYPGQALVMYTSEVPIIEEQEQSMEELVACDSELVLELATYEVKQGDSLWGISRDFNCRVSDLCLWNKLAPSDKLKIGQVLIVKRVTRKAYASPMFMTDMPIEDDDIEQGPEPSSGQPVSESPCENRPSN